MVFIKTITIQGFKSYRDQTQIEPFSPRHNVVLGRNGSGKSNFFAAIRFVLSDAYASMTREERAALLHEGAGAAQTLSAFVEIVFDNADSRFPTGHDEVVLRRTIGLKKDEYALDKRSASRADVMNLLESAGFSRSNPYYIVPQGRITALTNAKDAERLALLKEVAGTKVYEQKRAESLKIMEETDAKRTKINELLTYIEERLADLEEEKAELAEFQTADKERRCLEYALYQRELADVTEALDEVEEERRGDVDAANVRRRAFSDRETRVATLEAELSELKAKRTVLNLSVLGLRSELDELVKARTELRCNVADAESAHAAGEGRRAPLSAELEQLETKITRRTKELAQLERSFASIQDAESTERTALDTAQARLDALRARAGRAAQFRNKKERDAYLRGEIASIDAFAKSQAQHAEALAAAITDGTRAAKQAEESAEDVARKMDERRAKLDAIQQEIDATRESAARLSEERKELWREETRLAQNAAHAMDELRAAERTLAGMMDKDTGSGLRAVERIKERLGLDGVYGPLYSLFEIPDKKYSIATELTAGNSLFHVVVDTDATAQRVLETMLRERTGRVTFMPLNRLKPKAQTFPSGGDAVPLLDKLSYEPDVAKAMQQVFGRTAVCRDLGVAAAYSRSHSLNTITLDGDRADRRGALTGGFHDVRRSRLDAARSVRSWSERRDAEDAKLKDVKSRIATLEQDATAAHGRVAVLAQQAARLKSSGDTLKDEGARARAEAEKARESVRKAQAERTELVVEAEALQAKITAYKEELGRDMEARLTSAEEATMKQLIAEVEQHTARVAELRKERTEVGGRRELADIELNENLRRRRDEIRAILDALDTTSRTATGVSDDSGAGLDARRRELAAVETSVTELQKKLRAAEANMDELATETQTKSAELEEAQARQGEDARGMARQQKHAERYLAKRAMLLGRRDEVNASIRDLGVLPEEAFEKYTSEKMDRLMKKLHTANERLKKFAHVNKKAFEQYGNFTRQRDTLLQRRTDLDASAKSIEELIEVLDQRKDEAIDRTFKQVARNFEEVFEQLVPAGRGRLIIQRKVDDNQDVDLDDEETQQSTVENYTGVSIKVSFNSKVDEGLRIQQLSGGQKSLVALATVFAIQKCDPAPFYLFDEIDANLDAQYRTAVATMIKNLASTAQFIATTFRPEMLDTADKFYGVLFDNQKVSSIRTITRDEAREFVEQEAMAQ